MTRLITEASVETLIAGKIEAASDKITDLLLAFHNEKPDGDPDTFIKIDRLRAQRDALKALKDQLRYCGTAGNPNASDCGNGFIVVFMPEGEGTVNHMRVIDAWGSSSPDIAEALATMKRNAAEDDHGRYSSQGRGEFRVYAEGEAISHYEVGPSAEAA